MRLGCSKVHTADPQVYKRHFRDLHVIVVISAHTVLIVNRSGCQKHLQRTKILLFYFLSLFINEHFCLIQFEMEVWLVSYFEILYKPVTESHSLQWTNLMLCILKKSLLIDYLYNYALHY